MRINAVKILAFIIVALFSVEASCQIKICHTFVVKGHVYAVDDYETKPYALQGAEIQAWSTEDSTVCEKVYSVDGGAIDVWLYADTRLKDMDLHVRVTYLGMESVDTIVQTKQKQGGITGVMQTATLDSIILHSKSVTIEETEVVAELQKMFQRGDTVFFNAGAVEMPTGSVLLDLVRRLPGLRFDNGKLTYNGRDIEEIRLNGDKFFQYDMSIALKNMPSDKLKFLKVYETANDTANANSDKHLVMDMVTDKPYTNIMFANADAGITQKPSEYTFGGDLSHHLKGDTEYSIYGTRQTTHELTMPVEKNSRTWFNLHVNNFKRNLMFYPGYEYSRSESHYSTLQEMLVSGYNQFDIGDSYSINTSHRISMPMPIQISGNLKGGYNWSTSLDLSYIENHISTQTDNDSYSGSPFLNGHKGDMKDEATLQKLHQNTNQQKTQHTGYNTSLKWSGRLSKRINNADDISLGTSIEYTGTKQRSQNYSKITYHQLEDSVTELNRQTYSPTDRFTFTVEPQYNHRFGNKHYWGLSYTMKASNSDMRNRYYDITNGNTGQATDGLLMIDSLSYTSHNRYTENLFGSYISLQWNKYGLKAMGYASPTHQRINTRKYNGVVSDKSHDLMLYRFQLSQSYKDSLNQYHLEYMYDEYMPPAISYMDITDYSDPLNIRKGSTGLRKSSSHTIRFKYAQGYKLNISSEFSSYRNQTASKVIYNTATGQSISSPTNINGNWAWRNNLHSIVDVLRKTFDLSFNYSMHHIENYVQRSGSMESVKSHVNYHNLGVRLSTGFSSRQMSSNICVNYNLSSNDDASDEGRNKTQGKLSVQGNMKYQLFDYVSLSANADYSLYHGYQMKSMNTNGLMLNMKLSYKFLKSRKATVSLSCHDIFKQCRTITSQSDSYRWNERQDFGTTRYILLSFHYNFNLLK